MLRFIDIARSTAESSFVNLQNKDCVKMFGRYGGLIIEIGLNSWIYQPAVIALSL